MKTRRGFIGSLLGLAITPKFAEKAMPIIKPETILDYPVTYADWSEGTEWITVTSANDSTWYDLAAVREDEILRQMALREDFLFLHGPAAPLQTLARKLRND
jgi:hypothetical protein